MPANPSRVASGESRACWVEAPGRAASCAPSRSAAPGPARCWCAALHSGISRGTELLVFRGEVPASEFERMRAPFQDGDFPAPVKYGYASVGVVEQGPAGAAWAARCSACYPHQTRYVVPADAVHPLPDGVPPARAVLAANMETAVNALWDAAPRIGDRIAVVGARRGRPAGGLAGRRACRAARCELIDTEPARAAVAAAAGRRLSPRPSRRAAAMPTWCCMPAATPQGLVTALRAGGLRGAR